MFRKLLPFAIAAMPFLANAAANGQGSKEDGRVQTATYSANQVYNVYVSAGQATMIEFEPGEDVENSAVALGDAAAWATGIKNNRMFIKPKADNPDTNVVIGTNKRTYIFSLITTPPTRQATYLLRFRYPDTEARLVAEQETRDRQAQEKRRMNNTPPVKRNTNYTMNGDIKISPTAAWDDGLFTWLEYADSRELPAAFKRSADGTEALVNSHVEGDKLVIHELNDVFILRLGELVVGIYNESYDPRASKYNSRGTSINAIRTEKANVQ